MSMNELLTGLEFIFYLLDLAYIKLQLLASKSLKGVEITHNSNYS